MEHNRTLDQIRSYFQGKLDAFGTSPRGVDWNSVESQHIRFAQIARVITAQEGFTVLDYGCGYAAFADFLLEHGLHFSRFYGFDIMESMVTKAREAHPDPEKYVFSTDLDRIPTVDYAVASGVFNLRLQTSYRDWTRYVFQQLGVMNAKTTSGFASTFLTKYSDPEKMVDRLYYADPCEVFDYCKKHFSRNVALLHDYNVYDFTIIVRKG